MLWLPMKKTQKKCSALRPPEVDVVKGEVKAESYQFVAQKIMEMFPNIKAVAFTLRGSISATHNTWSGALYDGAKVLHRSSL
jgi:2-dehydro-3-deoxygluconokinase